MPRPTFVSDDVKRAWRWLEQGELEKAEVLLRKLLQRDPANPGANHALATLAARAGELDAAEALYTRAANARPDDAGYALSLAKFLFDAGKFAESLTHLDALLQLRPKSAEAHLARGTTLRQMGRIEEAALAHRQSCNLAPKDAQVRLQLAETLVAAGAWAEVHCTLAPLLAVKSLQGIRARHISADTLLRQRRRWDALQAFTALREEDPGNFPAAGNLAELWRVLGRPDRAAAELDRAVNRFPRNAALASNRLVTLCYLESSSAESLCAEGLAWSRRFSPPRLISPAARAPAEKRKIRLGYYSCDWREHATCTFTQHLLAHHDRERFEIFVYQDGARTDQLTRQFRAHDDHWRETWRQTPADAAHTILADNLDVLVDIPGHFGNPRAQVIAASPAPVIIHYLGHAGTTGISAIGWRIADEIAEPSPDNPRESSERILRLPQGFFPYLGPTRQIEPNSLPALDRGHVTFGSVNSLAKISASTIDAWARVMHAIPTARFLLGREECADEAVSDLVRGRFRAGGFPIERLEFHTDGGFNDLSVYHQIDIALDTRPYNGVTTTCDALWMGVPVLTISGDRYIARCSASILTHLGRAGWIVDDEMTLASIAIQLASDLPKLSRTRAELREQFRDCPLGQVSTLTRAFEAAYERAHTDAFKASSTNPSA